MVITESWLTPDISDLELGFSNYNIFRADRNFELTGKSLGGGVLIAVRKHFTTHVIPTPQIVNCEELWLSIETRCSKICICGLYIPSPSTIDAYVEHCDNAENMLDRFESSQIYILGDFNLPGIIWTNDENGICATGNSNASNLVIDSYSFLNMFQMNTITNARGSCLDLIMTNRTRCEVTHASDALVKCDSYHPALVLAIPSDSPSASLQYEHICYDFTKANTTAISHLLLCTNWDQVFESENAETCVNIFYNILYSAISLHVPIIKRSNNSVFPKWFSKSLKDNIIQKRRSHRLFKMSNDVSYYNEFSYLRTLCKSQVKNDYNNYISSIENDISENNSPKPFWNHFNNMRKNFDIPNAMTYNDVTSGNGKSICDMFGKHFSSVFGDGNIDANVLNEHDSDSVNVNLNLSNIKIRISDIYEKLLKLDPAKGAGPDEIPPRFLRDCSFAFSRPLWLIFNKSLSSGVFPSAWKRAYVKPIHKNGVKSLINNYRPISILSSIPKLFESIITDLLSKLLSNTIISQQHGFCSGRSTSTNLIVYEDYLLNALENGFQVDSIYTDFSKAFDKVNHALLTRKLGSFGIGGMVLEWLKSYLSGRSQVVKVGSYLSDEIMVRSGVPQGSHLGPLLFILFINDIVSCFSHANILLYADDLKIFLAVSSLDDVALIQSDLNRFNDWCIKNIMILNTEKCKVISFNKTNNRINSKYTLNDFELETVSSITDLGVIFNSNLDFRDHYSHIVNKAIKQLGFIKRQTRDFRDVNAIKTLYVSLVRSILEYCSCIWYPYNSVHISKIEGVQNKFLRYIGYKMRIPVDELNYARLRSTLNIETLLFRRNLLDMRMLYNIINYNVKCPELLRLINFNVPSRCLRARNMFRPNVARTSYGANNPIIRICSFANTLDENLDMFNISSNQLKHFV